MAGIDWAAVWAAIRATWAWFDAEVVSAAATLGATYFAFRTVRLAVDQGNEQRVLRDLEKRERYFTRFAVDVAWDVIPTFRTTAARVVRDVTAAVAALPPSASREELYEMIRIATGAFTDLVLDLRERLRFPRDALGDDDLWAAIEAPLSEMEDTVTRGLEQLALAGGSPTPLDNEVRRYSALVLNAIYQYDVKRHALASVDPPKRLRFPPTRLRFRRWSGRKGVDGT